MPYLLDSNTLVEAKDTYYRFSFCSCFWDWIIEQNAARNIFSISRVYRELEERGDDLTGWCKLRGSEFFLPMDAAVNAAFISVSTYVNGLIMPEAGGSVAHRALNLRNFETNKREFLRGADPLLVAYAIANGYYVVTREVAVPTNSYQVKIPNICRQFGVQTRSPFEMLESLGAQFVLPINGGNNE